MQNLKSFLSAATFLLALLPPPLLPAQEKVLSFPDPVAGWADFSERRGVAEMPGPSRTQISLGQNEKSGEEGTDLLLHFNSDGEGDATGNYLLRTSWVRASGQAAYRGAGAAAFQNRDDGLILEGGPDSLFAPGRVWGDFTLEFWLYPANVQDGETLFLWKGSEQSGRNFRSQELRVSFQGRRILWKFEQFFEGFPGGTLVLQGRQSLLPRTWRHHLIRFDSTTGLLEYLLDNVPEASVHVTSDGRESSQVHVPRIGRSSQSLVYLGPNITALVDEFHLSGVLDPGVGLGRYHQDSGTLISRILDLGTPGALVNRMTALAEKPGQTALRYYIRQADQKTYRWTREGTLDLLEGEWVPVVPGQDLSLLSLRGRYLQIRADLLSDGTGERSPVLRELKVHYRPSLPPPPPPGVFAEPGPGKVTLKWRGITREGLAGYRIFYGTSPGRYTMDVDVGQVQEFTLDGLMDGRLYYFALVSYDKGNPPLLSAFSQEVSARPERDGP